MIVIIIIIISFIPFEYKFGLVHTLFNCYFNLSSDFLKSHHVVGKLNKILSKNAYPQKFIINAFTKFSITCLFQGHKFLMYLKKNL